jgi:hypothetical protein
VVEAQHAQPWRRGRELQGVRGQPGHSWLRTGLDGSSGQQHAAAAGPLPAFMEVIVSSSISKSGSKISGNTAHLVVVQTNPGYQPAPGHPGTGTILAQIC